MKNRWQRVLAMMTILVFGVFGLSVMFSNLKFENAVMAQTNTAAAITTDFNQAEALAKLREQIKGHETDPADKVFKNIQMLKTVPAGRLLAIMEFGYSRSLGVDCTHCHTPEKWESEDKNTKQVTRDMAAMTGKINSELLKNIQGLKSAAPTINCTTCHRGEIKPALNLLAPAANPKS